MPHKPKLILDPTGRFIAAPAPRAGQLEQLRDALDRICGN
jgi:hypothetical protein